MMNKSKIDWCDFSWNPVTGCYHECQYCYARKQAQRFCGDIRINKGSGQLKEGFSFRPKDGPACVLDGRQCYVLEKPFKNSDGNTIAFPAGFTPTLHEYRLPMPAQKKKPANIFVCSMADLFGEWVPEEWIVRVFEACKAAPWHNYLFLTKNPNRYVKLAHAGILPRQENFWYGTTATEPNQPRFVRPDKDATGYNTFVSIEPISGIWNLNPYGEFDSLQWVIVGAETGNRRNKITPKLEWIESVITEARRAGTPLLMKDSKELREIWKGDLIQEFPASLQHEEIPVPHCSECEHLKTTERHYDPSKEVTAMNHFCTAETAVRRVGGRYARTSPSWCPKRKGGDEK